MSQNMPSSPQIIQTPALANVGQADLDDAIVRRLIQDLVQGIYPAGEVAQRYGFNSKVHLKTWLLVHPVVCSEIRRLKALNDSDANVKDRGALKAAHVVEQSIATLATIIVDPRTSPADRISAYKEARVTAGMGAPTVGAKDGQGSAGATFNLVMQFSGGRPELRLSTTVVAPDAIAPMPDEDA